MVNIDKNIPIPAPRRGGRPAQWPWLELEIGDSFFMPKTDDRKTTSLYCAGSRHKMKFTRRREGDGWRIWRIA